jgi:hypothetical protein
MKPSRTQLLTEELIALDSSPRTTRAASSA